jgi:FtsP/CotA-like multicopper oxidase with cupredoxin domain
VQLSTAVVPGKQVALGNANLDPTKPDTPIAFKGVDGPHYLGPTIVAQKNRPVRVLFRNLLPTGVAGDLFLPVDTTIMGSGEGPNAMMLDPVTKVPMDMVPDQGTVTDGVRNPACEATPKPSDCYSENRATLHLHGGITPWISDGTPHQWTTPAGEATDYPKGVSVTNVPDMADPGPGAETFFYTNQQSARLLFYHDHSWGITRLNVYAGEAAPYLITDATEQKLVGAGGALNGVDMGNSGLGHSLTIEDKTFVSSTATMAQTDPTWNYAKWGGEGSLWVPHVYMPAQNPGSATGNSPFGRWMYGPWFWPPSSDQKYPPIANPYYDPKCDPNVAPFCEPAQIPSTPNVSVGMEAFNDTPIVNGTAYPATTVDPKAYRFRILNAANDRFWNLSWYVADPTTGTLTEVALKKSEVTAAQTDPTVQPTVDTTLSPKGPDWVQIGNEGGFLPAPAVIPAQDITYITDPTRFDFGNVDKHGLLMAPAERADVVVDFSQYRGKTLILYNDAPAAFPARVPLYDYYTGDPNQTPVGAPTTLPGYGPNTRTIMQVTVSMNAPAVAFDRPNTTNDKLGALQAAFAHNTNGTGVFESGQDPTIVGQAAYNSAYGTSFVGTGDCSAPVNPTAKCDGFARINQQGGQSFKFDTLSGNQISIPLQPKALHDEQNAVSFDPYGRAMASIGVEAEGATPLLQNITLFPYVNPVTEALDSTDEPSSLNVTPIQTNADGTQIWKITHNGVDTHPIHWHLYDVQVINRVTWDNIIIPPDPNELGWKDTVRVSPLEDTYVAVRPIVPTIPWGVTDSKRPLNPMMPIGAKGSVAGQVGSAGIEAGFNNTDVNGNPINPIVNEVVNFGWEYVWHCHMLSHEEMDMMRPVTVKVTEALPQAPVLSSATGGALSWTDGTPVNMNDPNSWTLTGAAKGTAEVGYRIQRADILAGNRPGPFSDVGTALANHTTFTVSPALGNGFYRVVAWNAAGDSVSNATLVLFTPPGAPGSFVALTPSRLLDTRVGSGGAGPIAATGVVDVQVTGRGGVPADYVGAVILNVTAVAPKASGYLTVFPTGTTAPNASNLNFGAGQVVPNLVLAKAGTGGKVSIRNGSVGTTDVVADVAGYFVSGTVVDPGGMTSVVPSRLLDTRVAMGGSGPVAANGTVKVQATGRGGVPATGVSAVVVNLTAVTPTGAGYLTAYPSGGTAPATSNVNFVPGQVVPNLAFVKLGPDGSFTIKNGSSGVTEVIADVAGYVKDGTVAASGMYVALTPSRILDTRTGSAVAASSVRTLTVAGAGGVPAATGISAVVLNVTVVAGGAPGYLTVYPADVSAPLASNLNFTPGQVVPNLVAVKTSAAGAVAIRNASSAPVNVIADVAGYFTA